MAAIIKGPGNFPASTNLILSKEYPLNLSVYRSTARVRKVHTNSAFNPRGKSRRDLQQLTHRHFPNPKDHHTLLKVEDLDYKPGSHC